MSNLILVFTCLVIGMLLQRVDRFPKGGSEALNAYVIYVALPALVLKEIAGLTLDMRALQPVLAAWAVMTFSAVLAWMASGAFKWSRSQTGAMILLISLGNTSFVGIPLIDAHLGAEAIPYAILYDQFGTFLALNTFGVGLAGYYSQSAGRQGFPLGNILSFPPFIALLLALGLRLIGYPPWLLDVLSRLASTLVPVVMVAVGLQWQLRLRREDLLPLGVALAFILVLEPVFALALVKAFAIEGLVGQVIVLEAAMPAMISAGVLAMSHNLAPKLTSAVVGYSLMFSLVTVWGWRLVIS